MLFDLFSALGDEETELGRLSQGFDEPGGVGCVPSPCVPRTWCFLAVSPHSTGRRERTDPAGERFLGKDETE